ncbi:hypothetical protein FNF27_08271 [Cafeteria roenbergensis]|uniref:Dynein heavy chain hydrolytic ATP-binding dynein motor region domain-containing protein n=1 Tax=Cafeteria roenbergensis TaxID=33653 RepID=A0A5A8D545_CAFRO|nr:hypothetical protein FNF27_08271 [Cafeteria roenbergensis]
MNRTKIETLITMQVHQKDVLDELIEKRVYRPDELRVAQAGPLLLAGRRGDFVNSEGRFPYRRRGRGVRLPVEYLGVKERLVITPLTDRCYITLSQANGIRSEHQRREARQREGVRVPRRAGVRLNPVCGYFITMNPGYAGRQELPENLKALFRGVAMMVPDREINHQGQSSCAVGYSNFKLLARKFFICYTLCEQQLSKQKHYDFGLRNILSSAAHGRSTKRLSRDVKEEILLYRTLRDMNMSKLVAQDVPLFRSMLEDLFPAIKAPARQSFPELEGAIAEVCAEKASLQRLNPKAVAAAELYGHTDARSGDWVQGVFAAIWEKFNNSELPYTTWIVEDGPVDAIWIEDLNTVLDDNRILTLSNGDRSA